MPEPIIMRQEIGDDGSKRLFLVGDFPAETTISGALLDEMRADGRLVDDVLTLEFENAGAVYRVAAEPSDPWGNYAASLMRSQMSGASDA